MAGVPLTDLLGLIAILIVSGAFAGLIAGLFGVGGGTVIVPALFYAFEVLGLGGEMNLHVAVGSSLAVIIATSFRSLAAHRAHGAVDEDVLKRWTPWVALGGLVGAGVAAVVSAAGLGLVYAVCVTLVAIQMGLMPRHWKLASDTPTGAPRGQFGHQPLARLRREAAPGRDLLQTAQTAHAQAAWPVDDTDLDAGGGDGCHGPCR